MTQIEIEQFILNLENVEREENFGYIFFFVGNHHLVPFVSIAQSDNDFDKTSHLDREGVFRVNIGVSPKTFDLLCGQANPETIDYSTLNMFMPHPHYAPQFFVCILNPSGENEVATRELIKEAHSIATTRLQSRQQAGN